MDQPTNQFATTYEYKVVNDDYLPSFENAVRSYLANGWELAGGVTTAPSSNPTRPTVFMQAMFRIQHNIGLLQS